MSKEVRVIAWCDGEHRHREEATVERNETLDGRPVVLDLCDPCNKLLDEAQEAVKVWLRRGMSASRATASTESRSRAKIGTDTTSVFMRTCQEPGCGYGVAPTRSALGQHTKTKHEKNLLAYDWSEPA